ncbi:MAG: hypothetical protein ACKVW3_09040 [Phycisphaerales bacterium]
MLLLLRGDQAPLPVESLAEDIRAAHSVRPTGVTAASPPGDRPGRDRIGNYRLLERLGEGGLGVVFMAEQEKPVRRRVALKIIKLGMDTKQVVARFEAERQALALMDHPTSPKSSTPARRRQSGRTSSWNWSAACPSPSTAIRRNSASASGWRWWRRPARRCSTRTSAA